MIHYAGVTAYNEVQSDTPVAVDNEGSGGTGLTTFLERRVVVAIREVTRRDLHEGGPASREGTDRISRGRRSPRGPSARPGVSPEPPAHPLAEERLPLQAAPRMCAHPPICDCDRVPPLFVSPSPPLLRGQERGAAARGCPFPRRPTFLRSPAVEINERLFRAARPSCERCPVISGERGREERLSADSSARPRLRRGCSQVPERGQRGPGCQRRREEPYPGASG